MKENNILSAFLKEKRKEVGLSQIEFANKAGLGLRFVRDLEQGKKTLRLDKVNQALSLFNYEMAPQRMPRKAIEIDS